jgi:hypothetical protein
VLRRAGALRAAVSRGTKRVAAAAAGTVTVAALGATAPSLGAGCAYPLRAEQPPTDARERQRAEGAACARQVLPRWLDDDALHAAIELDRREAQAGAANDSFRGATFTAQPPPSGRAGARAAALEEERRSFRQWCAGIRAGASGFAKP